MNADDIARFLRTHPQFFDQHPELLESISVAHPYGGRAIPIAERQTSEKVHRLSVALAGARDFPSLASSLYFHLREDFAVPHVALRVWGKSVAADFDEAKSVDDAQKQHAATMGAPQCGPATGNPFVPWFGESSAQLRSIALVPLGQTAVFGLLALGSEDPKRFFPEMGTLYLRRIGELCAAGVTARL